MRLITFGVVLVACAPAMEEVENVVESGSEDALERVCPPQTWPIEEQGHQLDRVLVSDGPGPASWWVPEEPRGLVMMLHANRKNASTMFTVEHEELYNELAARDIAYVAVTNTGGVWNLSPVPENDDYARVMQVRDRLIGETAITESTPLFAVGFSGGSMFAPVFARLALDEGLDVRGFSSHNTGPRITADVPALFTAHENDNARGIENAYEDQIGRGLPTTLFFLEESLVDPLRFTKDAAIDETESLAFFDELVDFGLIDGSGRRLVDDHEISIALDEFKSNSAYDDAGIVRHQVSVLWRKHVFSADRACLEAEFFADQL